ncbi:MAG TPA: hypothetical protein VKD90_24315 [Gemmataceae bacterium]|nr:hypothetical protein [Gemmataceae bacterium]
MRPRGIRALPKPRPGGRLDDLRRFLNLPDDAAWALIRAWLAIAFRERGPFPLLVLLGEQGSAKSTTARLLRRLIDSRKIALRSQPKDVRDLMIAAWTTWVLAFDNLSHLPPWLSDALCRLATGGGFGTRELYSDDEEQTFDATRPVILNGIEDFVTRLDLLDRSLLIRHPPIDEGKRRPESELMAEFEAAVPSLLAALFDYVAGGLQELEGVELTALPRMADFGVFAVACEVARAGSGDEFLRAYRENQAGANEQVLDESPVACAVRQFMADRDEWQGTPTELLKQLNGHVTEAQRKDREWPKKPNALSNKLKRLAPSLRRAARIDVQTGVNAPDGSGPGRRSSGDSRITPRAGRPKRPHRPRQWISGRQQRHRRRTIPRPRIVSCSSTHRPHRMLNYRRNRDLRTVQTMRTIDPAILRIGSRTRSLRPAASAGGAGMSARDIIAECMEAGVTLTPALDFEGPESILAAGLEQRLRDHKFEIIRELVGGPQADPRGGPFPPDWRFEWLQVIGMLSLRYRDATDPDAKALL